MKKQILFFLLIVSRLSAQTGNLGLPPITNFAKTDYKAGTQNWDIAQGMDGRLYFANNEGLLMYDGANWRCLPIKNGTCVRSLAVATDGKIYVGGQGEIGVFQPNLYGKLEYQSLTALIPKENQQFTDVWDIVIVENGSVCFRSSERLFQYKNGQINAFSSGGNLIFMGKDAGGKIFVQDENNGLMAFDGHNFTLFAPQIRPISIITSALVLGEDSTLVTTLKSGIFLMQNGQLTPWSTPIDPFLCEKRIYSAAKTPQGDIALGTSMGGLVVLDKSRRPVQWLQKSEGLLNSNVLFVYCDRAQNLWLGLDSGIAQVEINSPFYRILPDENLEGTGYAAHIFGQKLYLGTSNGLFHKAFGAYIDPFQKENFKLTVGSTGQVWGLYEAENELLMGHHEGAFHIENGRAIRISDHTGTWKFVKISDTTLVAGQYDGLSFFTRKSPNGSLGPWHFQRKLAGFKESCRILMWDKKASLWVSHPYRGVFQVGLASSSVKIYGKNEGLPSELNNYVFDLGGKMLVAGIQGIYNFDEPTGRFAQMPEPDETPSLGRTRFLQSDQQGNIWFCKGDETGVLWIEDLGFKKRIRRQVFPQLTDQLVGGFEHIYPYDEKNVFFAVEKGFLHLNPERLRQIDTSVSVLISNVFLTQSGDSLLAGGFPTSQDITLPYQLNSLRFAFAAPIFGTGRQIQFSCRMDGLEKNWSTWSEKKDREFLQLGAGNYVFWVKARNEYGVESVPVRFEFKIRSPWYASVWARILYAALILMGLVAGFRKQKKTFETEKKSMTIEYQRHTEAQQQELTLLQNEKLTTAVAHKNQELALATMHLVQKGEILSGIQQELTRTLEKNSDVKSMRDDLNRIVRTLQLDEQTDDDWAQFAIHFDSVHGDFLKRLREKYPQLTTNDHRLCAYLRMNLSTKEIANLLNISVRGVEGSRHRLRKKMGLDGDANLGELMNGL